MTIWTYCIIALLAVCAAALVVMAGQLARAETTWEHTTVAICQAIASLESHLVALETLEREKQQTRASSGIELLRERIKARAAQEAERSRG